MKGYDRLRMPTEHELRVARLLNILMERKRRQEEGE